MSANQDDAIKKYFLGRKVFIICTKQEKMASILSCEGVVPVLR